MDPPPAGNALPAFDFLSEFLSAPDFGESFRFDTLFDLDEPDESPLVGGYDDESCSFSIETYVRNGRLSHRRRRKRRGSRMYRKESVLLSPWYVNFLRPGVTRELTHELSSSDRFGEFRSLFRMKLEKVEELTNILVERDFITVPRSLKFRHEFRERSELLVMTALFRLGNGNSYRQCRSNTYI
jgi:hypothetical protein